MSTYCLTIQYDGSRYNGWQKQGNTSNTIQEKLETLLGRLYGSAVEIAGSGRTDAGVHALGQTASYHIPEDLDRFSASELPGMINRYLPEDIRILSAKKCENRFHARLLAKQKIYEYRIDNGLFQDVFARRYSLHVPETLNLSAMEEAAAPLLGTHDFKSFCDNKRMKKSTDRRIDAITFHQTGSHLTIRFQGNGFLYHMVRILAGTLLEVGLGHIAAKEVAVILDGKNRALAGPALPPQGLFLVKVIY